jgi:EpsI family protein
MSVTARLAAVLVALALPGVVVASRMLAPAEPRILSLEGVPSELPDYGVIAEQPLDPDALELLDPDDYLQRLYAPEQGDPVWLYVGLYSGLGALGAHDPDVCYPAQGWDVKSRWDVTVQVPGGEDVGAEMLLVTRRGQSQLVLYWFDGARRWSGFTVRAQLMRIYDSLRGSPQYGFVRLSAHFSGEDVPEEELHRLAAQLAPHIRRALELPDASSTPVDRTHEQE